MKIERLKYLVIRSNSLAFKVLKVFMYTYIFFIGILGGTILVWTKLWSFIGQKLMETAIPLVKILKKDQAYKRLSSLRD